MDTTLQLCRRTLLRRLSKVLNPLTRYPPVLLSSPRRSMSSPAVKARSLAFNEYLLRLLRSELDYETRTHPPRETVKEIGSFVVEERPGEQWVRLKRRHGEEEEITVDATMFDGFITKGSSLENDDLGVYGKLHISLVVDITKGEASNGVLQFLCSAWSDALVVKRVFLYKRGSLSTSPYMGPKFKELDEEFQEVMLLYLRERGIDDDFASLLHEHMINKDRSEVIRWMENAKYFIEN